MCYWVSGFVYVPLCDQLLSSLLLEFWLVHASSFGQSVSSCFQSRGVFDGSSVICALMSLPIFTCLGLSYISPSFLYQQSGSVCLPQTKPHLLQVIEPCCGPIALCLLLRTSSRIQFPGMYNAFDKLQGVKNYADWKGNMHIMLLSLHQWGMIQCKKRGGLI